MLHNNCLKNFVSRILGVGHVAPTAPTSPTPMQKTDNTVTNIGKRRITMCMAPVDGGDNNDHVELRVLARLSSRTDQSAQPTVPHQPFIVPARQRSAEVVTPS